MRAAAVLFILLLATAAQAAVSGKIATIGFESFIRPDCWIPLTIQTASDEDGPKAFDLQVVQSDLDGDEVVYTRPVTVNPGVQEFWACFKPDPINYGIPASGNEVATELAKRLRIFLYDSTAKKRVVQISVAGSLPQAAENGTLAGPRGQKLVLIVGRSPNVNEYRLGAANAVLGTMEDVLFVRTQAKDLPADALGYEAADAIVWTDEDPDRLAADQFRALRQYVRGGGRLVVIQNAETQRMGRLDDLLPVHIDGVAAMPSVEPLHSIVMPKGALQPFDEGKWGRFDPWRKITGPFNIARATANPDTVVDTWATWPDGKKTPYIARRLFGVGCVSWIAQDISDPNVTAMPVGWPRLWERIMDWRSNNELTLPSTLTKNETDKASALYDQSYSRDIGQAFNQGINLTGKTAAYITLAVVFFLGYWCVAGPGMYFVLAARKRTHWSWFVFGAIAVAATLLTVGVTRLVLRGDAQAKHLSLVRVSADGGEPAYVQSRIGIYLPRDENAEIALTERDTAAPAALTPLIPWPSSDTVALRTSSPYYIPVEGDDQGATVQIGVWFRSTLKKLQATWAGKPQGRINGKPVLLDSNTPLAGNLSNNTGQDLKDVVLVFRLPSASGTANDWCLALPAWKNGSTIDLTKEWAAADSKGSISGNRSTMQIAGLEKSARGPWDWAVNWIFDDIRASSGGTYDDSGRSNTRTFPLASLFDRSTTMANLPGDRDGRCEVRRRDVRTFDCSASIAGGAMVVLGQADTPIPLPLTVDGDTPENTGHTFFQCVVPMDQSHFSGPPTTRPDEN